MDISKLLRLTLILSSMLIYTDIYSQNNTIKIRKYCDTVEIKIMEQKEPSEGYEVLGEGAVEIHGAIRSVSDLNDKEIQEIKKNAAAQHGCIAFIDTKGLWDSAKMPTMASQNKLYYYWVKEKEIAEPAK